MKAILRAAVAVFLFLAAVVQLAPVADAEGYPWITVEKAMVNRLGGITVEGRMSAAPLYDQLVSTDGLGVSYEDEQGWHSTTIYADAEDVVLIGTNPDNFIVRQPAGRRMMITAEHASSRLQWAFSNAPAGFFGDHTPAYATESARWVTDRFSYDLSTGPLFVYSPNGKFKTGTVAVEVTSMGYWVEVYELDHSLKASGMVFDEAFAATTLRATTYR
jgi:hypothetical protein